MTRALSFLVRNWPLKLAAIILAILLYVALVASQNAQVWPGRVQIVPTKQPSSAVLLTKLDPVTDVRYLAPPDVANRLSASSFTATIDLSGVDVQPGAPFATVKVVVTASDPRVQILDYTPQAVQVQLDPLIKKTVPVQVDHGPVPQGLDLGNPILSADTVEVSGPESIVRQITAAEARVIVQPTGLDIDQLVDLVPVDITGQVLGPADLEPPSVRVQIRVASQLESKSLPVHPIVTGTPADGYQVTSVALSAPVVSVEGDADALATLAAIDTNPVSVNGASADVVQVVDLNLPDGVTALGPSSLKLTIHIRAVTATQTFSVGLVVRGASADRIYDVSTDQVTVTLGGNVGDLDNVNGASFVAYVDVDGLAPGNHDVAVKVTPPTGLTVVGISPTRVTVTVGSPATPAPSPVPSVP